MPLQNAIKPNEIGHVPLPYAIEPNYLIQLNLYFLTIIIDFHKPKESLRY